MERHQSGKKSVSPELRHLIGFTDVYNPWGCESCYTKPWCVYVGCFNESL